MEKALLASKLDLSNRGLIEIPPKIFEYKNLKKLDLSNNKIRSMPKEIGRLRQLKTLDLSNNELPALKAKFFDLVNLETLILNSNKLTALPKQIENLKKLRKLSLSGNQLEILPQEVKILQELRSLNIANNNFTKFPSVLLNLPMLKALWLGKNAFIDFPLREITNSLQNLKALYCFTPQSTPLSHVDGGYSVLQKQKGNAITTLKLMTFKDENTKQPVKRKDTPSHIFICYSHSDETYKNEIQTTLQGMKYAEFNFEFWCDDNIQAGKDWVKEIENALDRAGIAIFVISRSFLASKFIQEIELPRLLKKAENEGTEMLSIIARRCIFKDTILGKYQAINTPETPLNGLPEHEQDGVYFNLAERIKRSISGENTA